MVWRSKKANFGEKSSKNENLEGKDDRISRMPDEILIYILSFLVTRDAFRTSILSTRWKKLWASVPNLSFDPYDSDRSHSDMNSMYMNFIEKILLLHNKCIHEFRLDCVRGMDYSRVYAWISAVVERNVRNLTICDYECPNMRLPRSLFNCKTLEILGLHQNLKYDVPSSINLPCLKILEVSLSSPSKDLTEKLFCSSPMLEDLDIEVHSDSGISKYYISSPALKKLTMRVYTEDVGDYNSVAMIDAPDLEVLDITDNGHMHYIFDKPLSLQKASVDIDVVGNSEVYLQQLDRFYNLLIALCNTKNVSLGSCTTAAISYAVDKKWPVLPNTTHLELEISKEFSEANDFSQWPLFPNVEHLILKVGDSGYKNVPKFLALVPNLAYLMIKRILLHTPPVKTDFSEEQGVPSCLTYCLRKIEIFGLGGFENELKMIKYLLGRARVVETLTVHNNGFKEVPQGYFHAQISRMPRNSQSNLIILSLPF